MQFYAKGEIDVQEGESELKVGKTEDVRARAQYFLLADRSKPPLLDKLASY
jgi:hypothetical protein